jgi:hypothetical protein
MPHYLRPSFWWAHNYCNNTTLKVGGLGSRSSTPRPCSIRSCSRLELPVGGQESVILPATRRVLSISAGLRRGATHRNETQRNRVPCMYGFHSIPRLSSRRHHAGDGRGGVQGGRTVSWLLCFHIALQMKPLYSPSACSPRNRTDSDAVFLVRLLYLRNLSLSRASVHPHIEPRPARHCLLCPAWAIGCDTSPGCKSQYTLPSAILVANHRESAPGLNCR